MVYYIAGGIIIVVAGYFFTRFVFDVLLRGFAPILPSRPWVVEQIMRELSIEKPKPVFLALSTGRSGFFHALEKEFPDAAMVGIEPSLFPYIVARIQAMVRYTRIKIIRQPVHRVNVRQADFIYCHLYPDSMHGLGKKLKFECRPNTIILSAGFNIADLEIKKTIPLEDRRGKLDWLSKNQKLFQSKKKKYKKENKAFIYVI